MILFPNPFAVSMTERRPGSALLTHFLLYCRSRLQEQNLLECLNSVLAHEERNAEGVRSCLRCWHGLLEGRGKRCLRRRGYLVRAANPSHSDPEFLQPIDHRLRCLYFDIDLIVDVGSLDKPTAGIQFGEQVSILLTEKELGFD